MVFAALTKLYNFRASSLGLALGMAMAAVIGGGAGCATIAVSAGAPVECHN